MANINVPLDLSSVSTWTAILSVVFALLSGVFHTDFSPYVPSAAVIASSIVVSLTIYSKHHLAAAKATAEASVTAARLRSAPYSVPDGDLTITYHQTPTP